MNNTNIEMASKKIKEGLDALEKELVVFEKTNNLYDKKQVKELYKKFKQFGKESKSSFLLLVGAQSKTFDQHLSRAKDIKERIGMLKKGL